MGLFGRKRPDAGGGMAESEPVSAPHPTGIPDRGYNQPPVAPARTISDIARTTGYPQGAEGFARKPWKERTTSYGQSAQWARRGYDSIN